jgi:hypothetical protein
MKYMTKLPTETTISGLFFFLPIKIFSKPGISINKSYIKPALTKSSTHQP